MSKRPNPTTIGIFVVAGMVLLVTGTLLVNSSKLFRKTERYVLYFDASVKGLNPGAPVKFRGVTVGSVVDLRIRFNQAEDDLNIPVIIELDKTLLEQKTDRMVCMADKEECMALIQKGLRGLLQAQSLVTGLLYVELEVLPNAPPPVFHQLKEVYQEIPTASTDIQQLMENLASVDLKGITEKLNSILDKLDSSLRELQVKDINQGMTNLLASLNELANSRELNDTLSSIDETLDEFRLLSETVRGRVDPMADQVDQTLHEAKTALAEIRRSAQNLGDLTAPQTPLRRSLMQAIDNLGQAARSVSELAELLTRNPKALISGKEISP